MGKLFVALRSSVNVDRIEQKTSAGSREKQRHRFLPDQLLASNWRAKPSNSGGRNSGVKHSAHADSVILS